MMDSCCLKVRNLCFYREKNGVSFSLSVPALDLYAGRILAVVGESGCGKSTLSDLLALILRPQQCELFCLKLEGNRVDLMQATDGELAHLRGHAIGYVLQSGGLLQFLNVQENIMLPGRLLGYSERWLKQRAEELAQKIGIVEQLTKKPQYLSGGQRQRVAIARALLLSPPLLIADEPTAAVDEYTANEICEVFRQVVEQSRTALMIVSHDLKLMRRHADEQVSFELSRKGGLRSRLGLPVPLNRTASL